MKQIASRIPAMIGMGISLFSFGFVIAGLIASFIVPPPETGNGMGFNMWIFSVLIAMLSLVFYIIDGVISIWRTIKKENTLFNKILLIVIFGSIPMMINVGACLGINILIWNLYYLTMFILEAISISKQWKRKRI